MSETDTDMSGLKMEGLESMPEGREPDWVQRIRKKGEEAMKTAPYPPYGKQINLNEFLAQGEDAREFSSLEDIPEEVKRLLDELQINSLEQEMITGIAVQSDAEILYEMARKDLEKKGVEIISMEEAVRKYEWVKDYMFRLIPVDGSKFTAYHAANWSGGVFVRVKKGAKIPFPVHAFFLIRSSAFAQAPHTLVIAEEGSELHFIEGCTSPVLSRHSLHVGSSEIYVKKGAKVQFTVLQNWPGYVHTRPLTAAVVEEEGELKSTTAVLGGGASTQAYPVTHLRGRGARAVFNSVILAREHTHVDIGADVFLEAPETSASVISKAVAMDDSVIINRGTIFGQAEGGKGHISCDGLNLSPEARIVTYPGLSAETDDLQLSHEAALGRVAEEQLFYLMSRGLSEERAVALIVNGFVEPVLRDIPEEFSREVKKVIEIAARGM